jgi:hypothetical protein
MTEGYRKAALKLHGLSGPDRAWMLQQLPAHERTMLSDLLRELNELGIKPDQRVTDDISHDDVRQTLLQAGSAIPGLAEALDVMCAARPAEVSALLSSEPDNMAAIVLSAYPWPWRSRLLADYGVEKRQRISRALQQAPQLKPRLRAELVKVVADRLIIQRTEGLILDEVLSRDARSGGIVDAGIKTGTFFQRLWRWLP